MSEIMNTSTTDLPASSVARSTNPLRRALLTGGAATAALAAGLAGAAGAPAAHPDAELIQLGADLRQASAEMEAFGTAHPDEDLDLAIVPCYAVVALIELATARTLAGLQVKAMAVAWCSGATLDALDPYTFDLANGTPRDERIMATIVRDLLALTGSAAA